MFISQVMNGHKRNDGCLEDYCDGSAIKEHPLFSVDPTALQIMLYYDDVEVCVCMYVCPGNSGNKDATLLIDSLKNVCVMSQ